MRHGPAWSMAWPGRRMAPALSIRLPAAATPAMRYSRTKRGWSARSSTGSAGTVQPLVRCVAAFPRRASGRAPGARCGSGAWSEASCTIPPLRAPRRVGKRARGPGVRVCGPSGAARCRHDARPPTLVCRPPHGSPSPSRPWETPASLLRSRSSCKTIAVMRGHPAGAHALCCQAWCNVSRVALPSTAHQAVAPRPRARPVPTRLPGAWERRPIALAGNGSVPLPRSGPISWTSRCGGKSRDGWPTPNAWRKNSSVGYRPPPLGHARHRPRSRPNAARCAKGWRG